MTPGKVSAACGDAAFRYVIAGIEAGLRGEVDAVCTGPLNKEALHAAGHRFPGHTEIFAARMGAERSCMMQYSEEITCSFVTTHVGYAEVPALLTHARILDVIELTAAATAPHPRTRSRGCSCAGSIRTRARTDSSASARRSGSSPRRSRRRGGAAST